MSSGSSVSTASNCHEVMGPIRCQLSVELTRLHLDVPPVYKLTSLQEDKYYSVYSTYMIQTSRALVIMQLIKPF